jgi:replicative DNA helicase
MRFPWRKILKVVATAGISVIVDVVKSKNPRSREIAIAADIVDLVLAKHQGATERELLKIIEREINHVSQSHRERRRLMSIARDHVAVAARVC